jgi:adenine-specific DNA-methyltransferase
VLALNEHRGAVYTPAPLARWVAGLLSDALPRGPVTVADLACGRAALLAAVRERRRDARLVGVDVDDGDLRLAAAALRGARLIEADALALRKRHPLGQVDGVILNPPWGIALDRDARTLRALGYSLARGQFDSANLFVELALAVLREGGVAAFILPDSIFFPEHAPLRRLLLARTELLHVARLGEGFFAGVFRGAAVVLARNAAPAAGHAVECLSLGATERRAVLAGRLTLDQVRARRAHAVPQARFAGTRAAAFEISVRHEQAPLVAALREQGGAWARWFDSGRGVELSKSGEVVRCASCAHAWPRPRRPRVLTCPRCGAAAHSAQLALELVVRAAPTGGASAQTLTPPLAGGAGRGWAPLIAGVDVRRYRAAPSREIRTGVPGISYKLPAARRGSRILVRKTGVGLRAALTSAEAFTTQVVFHYVPAPRSPQYLAAYVQGVLSSRVMLAFHLLSSGESEWRSHPYVTQRVIDGLPIPDPVADPARHAQAGAIAAGARALAARPDDLEADLALEGLVAGLFGLDRAGVAAAAAVLDGAQSLAGIRDLRFDPRDVTPAVV